MAPTTDPTTASTMDPTAEQFTLPTFKNVEPQKIYPIDVPKLTRTNCRSWKTQVRDFLQSQGCWQVVEMTYTWRLNDPQRGSGKVTQLLADAAWSATNALAKIYLKKVICEEDVQSVHDFRDAGRIWGFLMDKYERRTAVDMAIAIQNVTLWKKDPNMSIEASLQQLESLHSELMDISNGRIVFDGMVILVLFLNGLPKEYDAIKFSIMGNENLTRANVVSRLQHQEQMQATDKPASTDAIGVTESANRAFGGKCFACGKRGHRKSECDVKSSSGRGGGRSRSRSRSRSKGRNQDRGRNRNRRGRKIQKGKARQVDEVSDDDLSDSDKSEYENANLAFEEQDVRISQENAWMLGDKLAGDTGKERADRWVIDGGATSHCTGDIRKFESLDRRYRGILGTAGTGLKIHGKGTVRISFKDGTGTRLRDVLYVPGMRGNLLSTQLLHADGIFNTHDEKGYRLFRKSRKDGRKRIVATGYNEGRTSFLRDVKFADALLTKNFNSEREYAYLAREADEVDWTLLHGRLGHPGNRRMRRLARKLGLTVTDENGRCEVCIQAKSTKRQNKNLASRATRLLERVYVDFWGPYMGGYYLSITDSFSRFSWIFITKDRQAETVIDILEQWLARQKRLTGNLLMNIRLDNAREFMALESWAKKKGIDLEFTEPYTPAQNGPAERLNRLLLEIARSLLIQMNIPKWYWKYAVRFANYLRNRTVFVDKMTPYEILNGKETKLSELRVPFCKVWFHVKADDKLDVRAQEGIFVAYTKSASQFIVLDKTGRERKVTNPIFMEDEPGWLSKLPGERDLATEDVWKRVFGESIKQPACGDLEGVQHHGQGGNESRDNPSGLTPMLDSTPAPTNSADPMDSASSLSLVSPESPPSPLPHESPKSAGPNVPLRYSTRVRKPTQAAVDSQITERIYGRSRAQRRQEEREASRDHSSHAARAEMREQMRLDEVANLSLACELFLGDFDEFAHLADAKYDINGERIPIPQSYEEAVSDLKYGNEWRKAIHLEIHNLVRFGTWKFVKRPPGRAVVSCKWVFDIKYGSDGRIERFKARLVARGFSQKEGLDFEETFSHVVRLESLRVLFAIAASYGLIAHLLDATNAFVGSKLDRQIYMEVPKGLPKGLQPNPSDGDDQVCELLQSLYGLRQSANLWNKKVQQFVSSIGFRSSTADPSVFINDRGNIIALYVDDILIFGKDPRSLGSAKRQLMEWHPMKDSGLATKILGIRITWDKNSIRLDQEHYARQVLTEFGMENSNRRKLPISLSTNLSDESSPKLNGESHSQFRSIIGRLTYLAGGTRVDFHSDVNRLSQHLAEPRRIHLEAAKHILRYLVGTINYGLSYVKGSNSKLVGYSDAAYANSAKLRSTSGYVFILAGGPVSWSSRKQPITAASSSEAEYIAAAEAAKQAVWLRHFLYSIRKSEAYGKDPTTLYIDNTSAMRLAENAGAEHARSKHIKVRYHLIRDLIDEGIIRLTYVPAAKQLADKLTKIVGFPILAEFVKALRLTESLD